MPHPRIYLSIFLLIFGFAASPLAQGQTQLPKAPPDFRDLLNQREMLMAEITNFKEDISQFKRRQEQMPSKGDVEGARQRFKERLERSEREKKENDRQINELVKKEQKVQSDLLQLDEKLPKFKSTQEELQNLRVSISKAQSFSRIIEDRINLENENLTRIEKDMKMMTEIDTEIRSKERLFLSRNADLSKIENKIRSHFITHPERYWPRQKACET